LRRECAQSAFQAHINLAIHQRLRHFKFGALDQFSNQFVLSFMFGGVFAFRFHAFANTLAYFV